MACGCSKRIVTGQFVYVNDKGVKSEPTTQVQAKAQWIRAGKVGEVKPA